MISQRTGRFGRAHVAAGRSSERAVQLLPRRPRHVRGGDALIDSFITTKDRVLLPGLTTGLTCLEPLEPMKTTSLTRRDFLKATGAVSLAAAMTSQPRSAPTQLWPGQDPHRADSCGWARYRRGLCGALAIELVAIGDLFEDHLEQAPDRIRGAMEEQRSAFRFHLPRDSRPSCHGIRILPGGHAPSRRGSRHSGHPSGTAAAPEGCGGGREAHLRGKTGGLKWSGCATSWRGLGSGQRKRVDPGGRGPPSGGRRPYHGCGGPGEKRRHRQSVLSGEASQIGGALTLFITDEAVRRSH